MNMKDTSWLRPLIFGFVVLLLSGFTTSPQAAAQYRAEQWQTVELTFRSRKTYNNPFLDVDLWAYFNGPGGEIIKRPAFWDGGDVWKVRFAPSQQGLWTYKTYASNGNPSLNHQSGSVVATAYSGTLDIYRHGFLRKGRSHNLVYADGTPFFWLSDDLTEFDNARWAESNKYSSPIGINLYSQWMDIVNRRTQQGYSVLQYAFLPHLFGHLYWEPNQVGKRLKVEYFREIVDRKVKYVAESGLVSAIALGFHGDVADWAGGLPAMKMMAKYVVARYGSYPMIWNIVEPDQPNAHPYGIDRWREVAKELDALDQYNHPQAVWYWGTAKGNKVNHYLNESPRWVDAIIHQCGHGSIAGPAMWPTTQWRWYYENYPTLPMVEAGGCNFEQIYPSGQHNDSTVRYSAYRAVQSGSMGFGYGAQGLWNMVWNQTDTSRDWGGQHINWYDAIDFAGGYQMGYLKSFYTSLPWYELVPRPTGFATWNVTTSDYTMPLVKSNDGGRTVVVYFPHFFNTSGSPGRLNYLQAPQYTARWFNPRNGTYIPIAYGFKPQNGSWTVPQKPDSQDWVLLVQSSVSSPVRYLDGINVDGIAHGWVVDPDAPGHSTYLHFYIGGPANIFRLNVK
jgi:hypothetical protein